MNKNELCTPSILVDIEKLKKNIADIQQACDRNMKSLVPMTKTHKSSYIAKLQLEAGAKGLLVGTIREAERFTALKPGSITFAYPFIGQCNLKRMLAVGKQTPIIVSVDAPETAMQYDAFCKENDVSWEYLLIVDVGLHRFGVHPAQAGECVRAISQSDTSLKFRGIATHAGHVYAAAGPSQAAACFAEESALLRQAKDSVSAAGFFCDVVACGSTPLFSSEVQSDVINVVRPGNYVFYDTIQALLGADPGRCALTVLASVIAKRSDRRWVIDAGSKCLGLDKGAHGNSGVKGYGTVIGREGLAITSLSEEVGILESDVEMDLQIGERIEIIPNHSCSAANMTSHAVLCRKDEIVGFYEVDAREGTYIPPTPDVPLFQ
jgi:D-serine deaminase-like pyridoxal phosphate-dependent protein